MANSPQARKRIRRNDARAEINGARMSRIRSQVKKVELACEAGDKDAARAFWNSPEYAEVKTLREGIADCQVLLIGAAGIAGAAQ